MEERLVVKMRVEIVVMVNMLVEDDGDGYLKEEDPESTTEEQVNIEKKKKI